MSTEIAKTQQNTALSFRKNVTNYASNLLRGWVGDERASEATGRLAVALSTAAASARKPDDFYNCTQQSIAAVVAISALTGIMVGTGANALAYAIPRRPRQGQPPQLQYQLSHRGIAALASRAKKVLLAVPVSVTDEIKVDDSGDVSFTFRDFDNPPLNEEQLRGVVAVVKDAVTGSILAKQWVSKSVINERRDGSDSYKYALGHDYAKSTDPWHVWYVEMAMKTAMHYAIARGWCVIDDTEALRALNADVQSDVVVQGAMPLRIEEGVDGEQKSTGGKTSRSDIAKSKVAENSAPPTVVDTSGDVAEESSYTFNDLQTKCFDVTSLEEADEIDALIANSLCSPTEKEDLTQILQAWRDQPKA